MATTRRPRRGSMQFYPRKRAASFIPRVRSWGSGKEAKLLGFAGYKVGMTHVMMDDNRAHTPTKGTSIACPCTIIECPPLKAVSLRFYQKNVHGFSPISEIWADTLDKEVSRARRVQKKAIEKKEIPSSFDELRIVVQTQPKLTGIGKKKPELFEIGIGGDPEKQAAYAQQILGKEINLTDIFKAGEHIDIYAIGKGKGIQGPVQRFGISLKHHKSEKGRRNPGSLGDWRAQVNVMWRVPHAGQTGLFQRNEFNKWIIYISEKPENPSGGFHRYGIMRNPYLLLKGSAIGSKKRLILLSAPKRPNRKIPTEAPKITHISR